jgi:hypothetical protein
VRGVPGAARTDKALKPLSRKWTAINCHKQDVLNEASDREDVCELEVRLHAFSFI